MNTIWYCRIEHNNLVKLQITGSLDVVTTALQQTLRMLVVDRSMDILKVEFRPY